MSSPIRPGTRIRQDFLDFFKSKQHTIVPSSSLLPDSPNLLFTNAGMNQFVPIFLGQLKCPYSPPRAADTQKCIRAGGKHNDLEDVGLDTYHHTFFEMLGNWSFGDYFKKEAIDWAWELITQVWQFPKERLYATVYSPDKSKGDPSEFDQEAYDFWAAKFSAAGLDPKIHIVYGNKKDNFWMMGETGPCGPCSELHVDLTPAGDTKGSLVNKGDARCIEIWNLVFIQFNANPDGTFSPLPAKHVDTGMGFERVTSIIQGTKGFKDFANAKISNYETDIFRPIFDALEKLSGKKYLSTLPSDGRSAQGSEMLYYARNPQLAIDVAFRVIADHLRTLSFAIADGIQPGNTDRNYVLRRILRRAIRYGRNLGFHEPFFYKLGDVLAETMGDVFPEIRAKKKHVQDVIRNEEEAFNKTLDEGSEIFDSAFIELTVIKRFLLGIPSKLNRIREQLDSLLTSNTQREDAEGIWAGFLLSIRDPEFSQEAIESLLSMPAGTVQKSIATKRIIFEWVKEWQELWKPVSNLFGELEKSVGNKFSFTANVKGILNAITQLENELPTIKDKLDVFPGRLAFKLYDTYGFPLDLTELMARERGLTVDIEGFNKLMEEQKSRARAAQKKEVISLSQIETTTPTKFIGYDALETSSKVLEIVSLKDKTAVILDTSTCYAEMGGQVGDTAELSGHGQLWSVTNTQKSGNTWLHFIEAGSATVPVASVGVPPTESGRAARTDLPTQPTSRAPEAVARDAQQGDRDGRAPQSESPLLPAPGSFIFLSVNRDRRSAIERHHTVTHLLHWALHEVVSHDATQKGSFVGPDKLTFDFNSPALTPAQVSDIEKLVNERILANAGVSWTEVPHADVKNRKDIMQFFGDKYGDTVRVVQIGGHAAKLDGYSMELCGGTHTRATGEIGLFRIVGESAIAAGVRRIEAVAGLEAYRRANDELQLIKSLAGKVSSPVHELDKKIDSLLAHQKELEKALKATQQREASNAASELLERVQNLNGIPAIIHNVGGVDGDFLQAVADSLKGRFQGVIVLGGSANGAVALIASVSPDFTAKVQAGKIIQTIAPIVGGKGGGKPDNARGGGKDAAKLDEALARAKSLLG